MSGFGPVTSRPDVKRDFTICIPILAEGNCILYYEELEHDTYSSSGAAWSGTGQRGRVGSDSDHKSASAAQNNQLLYAPANGHQRSGSTASGSEVGIDEARSFDRLTGNPASSNGGGRPQNSPDYGPRNPSGPAGIKLQAFPPTSLASSNSLSASGSGRLAVAQEADHTIYLNHPRVEVAVPGGSTNSHHSARKLPPFKIRMINPLKSPFAAPAHASAIKGDEPDCVCCCFQCICKRFITHCWFLFACCGFLVISSLPRIFVLVDVLTTLMVYFINVRQSSGDMGVGEFIEYEFNHYDFRKSTVSVVLISVIRFCILFYTFAYRFHTNRSAFLISTVLVVFSAIYVSVKLVLCTNPHALGLLVFSLVIITAEYAVYILVRRQRIIIPKRAAPERSRLWNADFKGESYQSLPDTTHGAVPTPAPLTASTTLVGVSPESLADPDSLFVTFDRLRVHYKKEGSISKEHGHAILLLHGFGGSVYSWRRAMHELARDTMVVAFDRPGFGLTSRPILGDWVENPYTTEYSVSLCFRLMDHLGIRSAIVVGHSSGAAVAVQASLAVPDRVAALVLVSPTIYTEGFPQLVRSLFRTRLGKELVKQLVRTEIGEVALRRAWHDPDNIPDDIIANYKRTVRVVGWHEALMELTNVPPPKLSDRLASIKCPVLILHGSDDKLVALSESKMIAGELAENPYTELLTLENGGHVPHEEFPELFVRSVRTFLSTTFGASGNAGSDRPLNAAADMSDND